ncbi:MAG: hypothetical protein V3U20_03520, partial [Thermoplasmata archaeon]
VPFSAKATGDLGNEPSGGYSEGNEVFAITTNDFASQATTSFDIGEIFRVTITSYLVDLQGNGQSENTLYITDYQGNLMGTSVVFTQQDDGNAHVYSQTISAPSIPDHYLVVAKIEDGNGNKFAAKDVIIVGVDSVTQKYIKTYSDDTYSTVDWTFSSQDTIYIEVYSEETPSNARSSVKFTDYSGGESTKEIKDLEKDAPTMVGNYARIEYDLSNDLDATSLFAGKLNDDYWYGLTVDLRRGNGGVITGNWTIQIQITEVVVVVPSLSVQDGATYAEPSTVVREGSYITTISTRFEDTDEPSGNSFLITFKVRDSDDKEINLVDGKSNGQSGEFGGTLIVISSGGGIYTASYELDPDDSFITGFYDLYFKVEDGTGEAVEDGYQNNRNELEITSSTFPPHVNNDATQCTPNTVNKIGEYVTTISAQFSDSDSLSIDDFTVLFKIKGPDDREIILVNNKTNGQTGEFGGSLSIISSAEGVFTASYTFDPDGSFKAGDYDLFFKVIDQHGNSDTDEYFWNRNELEITSSAAEPTVDAGETKVNPNVVNKTGDDATMITAQFEDADSDSVSNFTVTFKVKHENGTEYVIVNSAKNGDSGEYGGTVTITLSGPNGYIASYVWNPPSSMPKGNYSLYFKVEDEWDNYAEDGYVNNLNELTIIGEEGEPEGDGEEEQEAISNWAWILLVVIILIILFILLIAAKKRKGKAPYMPPKTTEEDTHPPSSYEDLSSSPPEEPS